MSFSWRAQGPARGHSTESPRRSARIDYLVFDYLAETTMAILASARLRKPDAGYATDFVDIAMKAVLPEVMRKACYRLGSG